MNIDVNFENLQNKHMFDTVEHYDVLIICI